MQKKQLLILSLHCPNRSPSQRFRFEQYIPLLTSHHWSITHSYLLNVEDYAFFYKKGAYLYKIYILLRSLFIRFRDVIQASHFDAVFIQRESFMLGTTIFERLISGMGVKIIYDFDDAIWLSNVSESNKELEYLKRPTKIKYLLHIADCVIAGNPYLADYAKQFNAHVKVIPTTIDTDTYKPCVRFRNKKVVSIGWSGSLTTILHFDFITPILEEIQKKFQDKVEFLVVGAKSYQHERLNIKSIAWTAETEVASLNHFDIGIMPLPDNNWTRGKCGLKALQYMALGIPAVVSDVGVNASIVRNGKDGFVAKSSQEWVAYLSLLIEQPHLRKEMGTKGRQRVEQYYSLHSQSELYLNTINSVNKTALASTQQASYSTVLESQF